MDTTLTIFKQLGEAPLRPLTDPSLDRDMQAMNTHICQMQDESIINMQPSTNKQYIRLMKLYANLGDILHYLNPPLLGAASLRTLELVFKFGLTPLTPLAFACYGEVQASFGNLEFGCRLGKFRTPLYILRCKSMISRQLPISICRPACTFSC